MELTLKVYVGDEIRRLTLQDNCSYVLLRTTLINLCSLPRDFLIKYKDEEGDMVSITSDLEFQAAKILATEPIFRLWIYATKMENAPSLVEQVISSPVIQAAQQLSPYPQAGQQTAQQAARQACQELLSQASRELLHSAEVAQQAAQETAKQVQQSELDKVPVSTSPKPSAAEVKSNFVPSELKASKQIWKEQLNLLKDMGFCQ